MTSTDVPDRSDPSHRGYRLVGTRTHSAKARPVIGMVNAGHWNIGTIHRRSRYRPPPPRSRQALPQQLQVARRHQGPDPETKSYPSALDRWKEIPKGARIVVGVVVLLVIIGAASSGGSKKTQSTGTSTQAIAATSSIPAPPPVALTLATGDYSVTGSHTTLRGTVTAGAAVSVDEQPAQVHGTHWSKTVALQIGSNPMTVGATLSGHETG